jgi:lipopolysaccharide assembly outer membrane protein LptD (OstA)
MKIKFLFIFLLFFNYSLSFSDSYIKASNGITWDKTNQTYSAEGSAEFKNNEIQAFANKILASYIFENDKEIFQNVELNEEVEIFYNNEVFKSDTANYNKLKSLIILRGNVSIVSPDRYLSGDELVVDLEKNTRVLKTIGKNSLAEALIKDE